MIPGNPAFLSDVARGRRDHQWMSHQMGTPAARCRVCGQSALTCIDITRCPGPYQEPERKAVLDLEIKKAQMADGPSLVFILDTKVLEDGKINQELRSEPAHFVMPLSKWVVDTREKAIREALIKLGWTPPHEETRV